ncbi:UDP-N-acetylmuramoyl-tripeptide--D-alanyl-D-alanine ligase [Patescibacteria group bacterium]
MKQFLKKILERILRFLSKRVLKRYHPFVIAITGSVGKTTTKEAVYTVVKKIGKTWCSELNYNNEIGVPLTILGLKPSSSPFVWFFNLLRGLWLAFGIKGKSYPEKLILEMGADKPGDIKYLTSFVKPNIAIITKISPVHAEFFGDIEFTAKEKKKLVEVLDQDGVAILNADDKRVKIMGENLKSDLIYYGLSDDSKVKASDVQTGIKGTSFVFSYEDKKEKVLLPNLIGEHFAYAALAAIAVGVYLGVDPKEIVNSLKDLKPPPHRLSLVKGQKGSIIIDDTYNASAPSVLEALKVLSKLKGNFRVAVLGDMLELGDYTETEHRRVGAKVAEVAQLLITVGEHAHFISDEALKKGFPKDKIFNTQNKDQALKVLKEHLQKNDVVLIKGSRGIELDKVVEGVRE